MKRLIAVLLAMVLTLGVCAVSAVADEPDPGSDTGTTYQYAEMIKLFAATGTQADEQLTLVKQGDKIAFPANMKAKNVTVSYYPDAAGIKSTTIKNKSWKEYVTSLGTDVVLASSDSKYKKFIDYIDNGTTAIVIDGQEVCGLGDVLQAADSSGYVWGEFPIDYSLKNYDGTDAAFLGWYLGNVRVSSSKMTIEFYGAWERKAEGSVTPDPDPDPDPDTDPDANTDSPIIAAMKSFFALFSKTENPYDDWKQYISWVPGIVGLLFNALSTLLVNGKITSYIYDFFGIEVDA